jgi:predicted nuclease of predicted toxin-antitoxin system
MKILIDMNLSPTWVAVFANIENLVISALRQFESELELGALVTIDRVQSRARILPIRRT